ncbi:MAG: acyl-CoA thioesterase [Gemmatimonadota bacterium]
MARVFVSRFRVRSYELDFLGHVNNAVYLNWLEQARLQALGELGYPLEALIERAWVTLVARIEIDYRREVRHGDDIRLRTEVERVGRTSLTLHHRFERIDDEVPLVAEARVVIVWIGQDGRPAPVPDEVRERLRS